jgi:hypothetical protein
LLFFAGQTDESLSTDCELDLLEREDEEDEAALEQRIARYGTGTRTVLWIHNILVRIRIRGSVPLNPDPRTHTTDFRIRILLFLSVAFKMSTKNIFLA